VCALLAVIIKTFKVTVTYELNAGMEEIKWEELLGFKA
jgi:hypothetical protein